MYEDGPKLEQDSSDLDREVFWNQATQEVTEISDDLGRGIDEGIRETVIALRVNGFPLSSSCEGHVDHGIPVPYVEISAPNQPKDQFYGQDEVYQQVAQKYNLPVENVKRAINLEAYWEARDQAAKNGETEEYKVWNKENEALKNKAEDILQIFYKDRKAKPNVKLEIYNIEGGFRIHNGGDDYNDVHDINEELSDMDKIKRSEKLTVYKKEMDDFAYFLKQKYFNE